MKHLIEVLLLSTLIQIGLPCAQAQAPYPNKPLHVVVPFPAGGSADVTARLLTSKMSVLMGEPVIVDNRVGASGAIGTEIVARSAPDGYTMLFTTSSTHIVSALLSSAPAYNVVADFTPISAIAESATGLVVTNSLPVSSVNELVDYAKRNPGKLTYSSAGIGSAFHLTGELFRHAAGIDIVHVPYKGASQALADLMNGTISMTFAALGSQLPLVRSGKVKMLAVLEPARYPGLPNVPTIAESLPDFVRPDSWMGLFGPARMPGPVVERVNGSVRNAITAPEVRAKFEQDGLTPIGSSPEQFAAMLRKAVDTYASAIKLAGLKAE